MNSSRRRKNPLNPRRFLWQIIRSAAARGSMPCWALPFEAIAASMLLKKNRSKETKKRDTSEE
jgi:hypothetical protein